MRGESFVKNLLKFGVVLLLYMNIGALNVLAQEGAVNGPNIDTVINGIAFDCYDLGTTTHIDPYGLVATQNQLQWAIDNGEVATIKIMDLLHILDTIGSIFGASMEIYYMMVFLALFVI